MSDSQFQRAMQFLLRWEGGESSDPHDPGGHTKLGISARAYPDEDIAALTVERASELYRRDYWARSQCDLMVYPIALAVFDMAVNAGRSASIKCLQRALGVADDAVLGPATLAALREREPIELAGDIAAERVRYYAALPGWSRYGRGWARRAVAAVIEGLDPGISRHL